MNGRTLRRNRYNAHMARLARAGDVAEWARYAILDILAFHHSPSAMFCGDLPEIDASRTALTELCAIVPPETRYS